MVPVEAIGAYDLNKKYSILAGVKYQWLTQNDLTHNSTGISDEATALLGVSRKFSDYTMASLGYQFVNGGLPGLMNVHLGQTSSDFPAFEHSRSEEHSFVLDIHHDFGERTGKLLLGLPRAIHLPLDVRLVVHQHAGLQI